jgi:hypothetical protein
MKPIKNKNAQRRISFAHGGQVLQAWPPKAKEDMIRLQSRGDGVAAEKYGNISHPSSFFSRGKWDSFDSMSVLKCPAGLFWRLANEKIDHEGAAGWTDTRVHSLKKCPTNNRLQWE